MDKIPIYLDSVTNEENSHVVAGANILNEQFLITYNLKHWGRNKIKNHLNSIVMQPGMFLQYLRSLKQWTQHVALQQKSA